MKRVNKINWAVPGENRYVGPVDKAIDSYDDIPKHIRAILIERSNKKQYTESVVIDAAGIRGTQYGYANLRQMFFGVNIRADVVDRAGWPTMQEERGLVYTEQGYSILIPNICSNVSRVDRVALPVNTPAKVDHLFPVTPPARPLNNVPEPGTLALVVFPLMVLIARRVALCNIKTCKK